MYLVLVCQCGWTLWFEDKKYFLRPCFEVSLLPINLIECGQQNSNLNKSVNKKNPKLLQTTHRRSHPHAALYLYLSFNNLCSSFSFSVIWKQYRVLEAASQTRDWKPQIFCQFPPSRQVWRRKGADFGKIIQKFGNLPDPLVNIALVSVMLGVKLWISYHSYHSYHSTKAWQMCGWWHIFRRK